MEVRLSLIRTLARWGFRFAGLHSRVNARPFRFITLLRVNASDFWQNGMEMRLSLITASSTTHTPSMCRIIDSLRANESGSSIPFGLTLSRKRPAPPDRTAIPEKPHRFEPKRNLPPASDRIIVSAALPLTCALARWGFRFAGLHSRVNARPFRFITLLRVKVSIFWAKRNGDAFIVNHCIPINPHAIDVPHYRQPARQRYTHQRHPAR